VSVPWREYVPLSYQKHACFGTPLKTFYMKHYHLKMMMMIQKPQLKDFFQDKST